MALPSAEHRCGGGTDDSDDELDDPSLWFDDDETLCTSSRIDRTQCTPVLRCWIDGSID